MWRCSHDLSIDEVLRDPIIRAQMSADQVAEADLEALLRSVAVRLASKPTPRCFSALGQGQSASSSQHGTL